MTRTSKNRIYIAITLLGMCALFVDRFLLGGSAGPVEAIAQDTTQEITARVQALSPTGLSIPELPFPRNLPEVGRRTLIRDLFAPPTESPHNARRSTASGADAAPSDAAMFASRNRLQAVISDGNSRMAVVNGKWVRIGQSIDGCKLTDIDGSKAHFQCAANAIVLDSERTAKSP